MGTVVYRGQGMAMALLVSALNQKNPGSYKLIRRNGRLVIEKIAKAVTSSTAPKVTQAASQAIVQATPSAVAATATAVVPMIVERTTTIVEKVDYK